MTEYNLTWAEAKEAMKRGAVVNGEIWCNHRLFNGYLQYSVDNDNSWISNKNEELEMADYRGQQWRIVDLTDCEIGIVQILCSIPPKFEKRCQKHACVVRENFYSELSKKLKDKCIQKFTEQLKEDMKKQANEKLNEIREIMGHEEFDSIKKEIMAPDSKVPKSVLNFIKEQKMKEPKIYSFEEALCNPRHRRKESC